MKRRVLATVTGGALLISLAACDSTPAPGPTQTSATSSNSEPVPAPTALDGGAADLGIKWNWNLKPPLAYAEQVGWGETFFEVEWCDILERPQDQRYRQVERIVGQAETMGYRMMLKIRVGSCSGEGEVLDPAEGTRKKPSTYPSDPAAYQTFVRELVGRYSARGVKIWAIENEVDANNFWAGSPQEYVDLVALASAAIKEADPEATILDAGISSTGHGIALAGELMDAGKEQEALELYQKWYERRHAAAAARFPRVETVEGLRGLLTDSRATRVREMVAANWEAVNSGNITAYQLHFYENPVLLPTLLDYVRRHLTTPMPIQAWEIGTAWPGDGYTEQVHGSETAMLLGTLLRERISPVVYLPLAYTPGGATKVEIFRGLVTPEGGDLPSGQVYAAYATAVQTSTAIRTLELDRGSGVLVVGPTSSLGVVWPRDGGALRVSSGDATSAAEPGARVNGEAQPGESVLIPLPGGEDQALEQLSESLGTTVSATD